MATDTRDQLQKRCDCAAPTKCPHTYWLHFWHLGTLNRISLKKHAAKIGDSRKLDLSALKHAETLADEVKTQIRRDGKYRTARSGGPNRTGTDGPSTFSELVDRFESDVLAVSEISSAADTIGTTEAEDGTKTRTGRLIRLSAVIVPGIGPFGDVDLADITPEMLAKVYATTANLAAHTRKKYRGNLKRVLVWAVSKRWLPELPLADNTLPTKKGIMRKRRINAFEESNLIAAAGESHDWAGRRMASLIVAALECGARRGELLAIQWRDVNWQAGSITLRADEAGAGKTGESRDVPLTARLADVLQPLQFNADGQKFSAADYVFGTAIGGRVQNMRKAWDTCRLRAHNLTPGWTKHAALDAASQAALQRLDLHFHDLRHECALRWHEAGLPLTVIAALLGHHDLTMLRIYLGIGSKDALAAHAAIMAPPPAIKVPAVVGARENRQNRHKTDTKSKNLSLVRSKKND